MHFIKFLGLVNVILVLPSQVVLALKPALRCCNCFQRLLGRRTADNCEGPSSPARAASIGLLTEEERKKHYDGSNHVQLAYSGLGGVPVVAQAYHTSVVLNGVEFFFSDAGIQTSTDFSSHRKPVQGSAGKAGVNYSNSESTQLESGGGGTPEMGRRGLLSERTRGG